MGKWSRLLERIAVALERSASEPRSEGPEAAALVADLEARMAGHVLALQKAVAELRERSPPEADLVKRIAAVEFDTQAALREARSLRSKVYRETGGRKREEDAMPAGVLGGGVPWDAPQAVPSAD